MLTYYNYIFHNHYFKLHSYCVMEQPGFSSCLLVMSIAWIECLLSWVEEKEEQAKVTGNLFYSAHSNSWDEITSCTHHVCMATGNSYSNKARFLWLVTSPLAYFPCIIFLAFHHGLGIVKWLLMWRLDEPKLMQWNSQAKHKKFKRQLYIIINCYV